MQETTNSNSQWLTIRVGRSALSFSMPDEGGRVAYEPYVTKSGVSLAANLREAFKTVAMLSQPVPRARVLIDSPVLMVPVEIFDEDEMETMYHHAFPRKEQETVCYNVLPDLNSVAVFSMNKDLRLVVDDHFQTVKVVAAMSPVWRHLHQRSYTGTRQKLYGYFHEKRLEVFCFQQNRFRFCNSFDAGHAHDSLYFLLYVWKQLQLDAQNDELHVVGGVPEQDWLLEELKKYVQKVYLVNPVADLNRAPVTEIKGMPYDLQILYVKGR